MPIDATPRMLNYIYFNWKMLQEWYSQQSDEGKNDIINHFNDGIVDDLGEALFGSECNYGDFCDFINQFSEKDQWRFIKFWRETEKTKWKDLKFVD